MSRPQQKPPIKRKAVIIGDGGCGKTCLLHVYQKGEFPPNDEYIPTIFEEWVSEVTIDGRLVELALWDTAGQEDYDNVRFPCYNGANIVLICFSVDSPDSLENVREKWIKEVNEHAPNVPTLLVGLKRDLRDDPAIIDQLRSDGQVPVAPEQGMKVATYIGASYYLECSAKMNEGVKAVFNTAIYSTMKLPEDSCCPVL
ncbi:GTP-binding protein Rho1 [Coemansia sp. RSA 552]|nr:GTP-binding protein Rho1 [Coemansia sp. RSA 552]